MRRSRVPLGQYEPAEHERIDVLRDQRPQIAAHHELGDLAFEPALLA